MSRRFHCVLQACFAFFLLGISFVRAPPRTGFADPVLGFGCWRIRHGIVLSGPRAGLGRHVIADVCLPMIARQNISLSLSLPLCNGSSGGLNVADWQMGKRTENGRSR